MDDKPNRVWMEIEKPGIYPASTDSDALAEQRAARMDKLLRKLGYMPDYKGKIVFWHPDKGHYCITIDEGGSFMEMGDNGHWFNLDWLTREAEKGA